MSPLEGIRVVELASNIAGPFTTLIFRDLGAEVIKVEEPRGGDSVRAWPPHVGDLSAVFSSMNRGKRSVALDVWTPPGAEVMRRLLREADVFVESLRPGTAERMGFSWEELSKINDRLICCSISAFGKEGPLGGAPGFDAIVQAYSGLMDLTGEAAGPPVRVGTGVIDFGSGLWAAIGVLSALHRRILTGKGGQVEATLLGSSVGLMMHHIASVTMTGLVPKRLGTAQHNAAPYEAIRAEDGSLMIGVTSQSLWERLCGVLGGQTLREDPRFAANADRVANREALDEALSSAAKGMTVDELAELLAAAGVPSAAVRSIGTLPDDEQIAALGVVQPMFSGERVAVVPVRIDGAVPDVSGATVPALGEDTSAVLGALGITAQELAELFDSGIAGGC